MNKYCFLAIPLLLVATGLARFNAMGGQYVFDDQALLAKSPMLGSPGAWGQMLKTPYFGGQNYRPLIQLSFTLQRQWGGHEARVSRLFHVVLHAVNALLLFWLVLRLAGDRSIALGAALLFSVHPIHAEALNNMLGRSDLLCATLILTACLIYLAPFPAKWRLVRPILIGLIYLAALGAKETAIILPILILLIDWFFGAKTDPKRRNRLVSRIAWFLRSNALLVVVLGLVTTLYLYGRALALEGPIFTEGKPPGSFINPLTQLELDQRLLGVLRVTGLQLWHLVWPLKLSPDYSYDAIPLVFSFRDVDLYLAALALIAGAVGLGWVGIRDPAAGFFAWFALLTFLPSSNLFVLIGMLMADRFLYLPSLAFCYFAAWAFFGLMRRLTPGRGSALRRNAVAWTLGLLVIGAAGARTVWYNRLWKNDETLFEYAVGAYPRNALARFRLANAVIAQDPARALTHLEISNRIAPRTGLTVNNIGVVLTKLGRHREAEEHYREALALMPENAQVHVNLGEVNLKLGRPEEAVSYFRESARLDPKRAAFARRRIAVCHMLMRQPRQ